MTYPPHDLKSIRFCCIRCHSELPSFSQVLHYRKCDKRTARQLKFALDRANYLSRHRNDRIQFKYKSKMTINQIEEKLEQETLKYIDTTKMWCGPFEGIPLYEVPDSVLVSFVRSSADMRSPLVMSCLGEARRRINEGISIADYTPKKVKEDLFGWNSENSHRNAHNALIDYKDSLSFNAAQKQAIKAEKALKVKVKPPKIVKKKAEKLPKIKATPKPKEVKVKTVQPWVAAGMTKYLYKKSLGLIKSSDSLTKDDIKDNLFYDPVTGEFIRKCNSLNQAHNGTVTPDKFGAIKLNGSTYNLRKLAVLLMTGVWIEGREKIKFKDGDKTNYKWENLAFELHTESLNA